MSDPKDYARLIDAICELGQAAPAESRHTRCDLAVEGTLFTLIPVPDETGVPNGVGYFADVGPLPQAQGEVAMRSLLETNLFMIGRDAPSFCANPDTGHIVLAGVMPLDRVTPETALQAMSSLAHFAADWRESLFHMDRPTAMHSGPAPQAAPRTVQERP